MRAISVRLSKTMKYCPSFTRTPLASQRLAVSSQVIRSRTLRSHTSFSDGAVTIRKAPLASQTTLGSCPVQSELRLSVIRVDRRRRGESTHRPLARRLVMMLLQLPRGLLTEHRSSVHS